MTEASDFDYWTGVGPSDTTRSADDVRIAVTKGVVPLQRAFEPDKFVPDTLLEPLFGPVASVDGTLPTYAILDAARITGLPELLQASKRPHRCLFQGDAHEDLGDVAPWLVHLDPDNRFTGYLFSDGDGPWTFWDLEPGIYLRSAATLEELAGHFRKFTRVRDESGKWFYWRFWEGAYLTPAIQAASPAERRKFFLNGRIQSLHIMRAAPVPSMTTLTLT